MECSKNDYVVSKAIEDDSQVEEEKHFYALFVQILERIRKEQNISDEDVGVAIDAIIEALKNMMVIRNSFGQIDFADNRNVCGYLFRYAATWAGLVRLRVMEAGRNCKELNACLQKERIKVISLGSGPGSDILGFLSASQALDSPCRTVDITLVDRVKNFGRCIDLMRQFLTQQNLGRVSKMFECVNIFSYCVADIRFVGRSYRKDLREADVILLSWLLSIVDMFREIPPILKVILDNMKEDALLVYIDSPPVHMDVEEKLCFNGYKFFKEGFDLLYLSPEGKYTLSEHHERYGRTDNFTTVARIAVLRKGKQGPQTIPEDEDVRCRVWGSKKVCPSIERRRKKSQ